MPQSRSSEPKRKGVATHEDLIRIAGDIEPRKAIDILALSPMIADIEEAIVWAAGNGDVLAKRGRPLAGIAAQIVDILTADEEEEPPPMR
jgi:hypothetical protein